MILQCLVTILLLQNGVLSTTLRHSRTSRDSLPEEKDNNLKDVANEEDVGMFFGPTRRQLGSWLRGSFLPGFSEKEVKTRKTKVELKDPKVTADEITEFLRDGYSKYNRIINDKETMDYASSLYNRDWQDWVDVIYTKDVQDWINSLISTIKKAIANYIVNTKLDQLPAVSTLRNGLKVFSPIIGDPSETVVSTMVDLLA